MKTRPLKIQILISQLLVVVLLSTSFAIAGVYFIKKDVLDKAQDKVKHDLNVAREVYRQELRNIEHIIRLSAQRYFIRDAISTNDIKLIENELEKIRKAESLDILTLTDKSGKVMFRARNPQIAGDSQALNNLVKSVIAEKKTFSATEIVPKEELLKEGQELVNQAYIEYIQTPRAKQSDANSLSSAMCVKAAAPVLDMENNLIGVLYGGILLNRNYEIVDKVKDIVFHGLQYKGKDVGTVTIFQEDVRISTNVTNTQGNRAIGTRVSEEVYNRVLVKAETWDDKAFVVKDWYKTAYEPIRDIEKNVIGMLYVGTLEQPFNDIARNSFLMFALIISGATALAAAVSFIIDADISRHVRSMFTATDKLARGELGHMIETATGITELNALAKSFNEMSNQLNERDKSLKLSNEMLTELNKRYIDLIGFVSHELKGSVAVIIMNVCSVRDEVFGQINEQQRKALDGGIRSLDYLTATVKKFLSLGRIEKGELTAKKTSIELKKDVFDSVVTSLTPAAEKKNITVINDIDSSLHLEADPELLQIVANNLISNAIKYGTDHGNVIVTSSRHNGCVRVEVYNDSEPIKEEQKEKLFKRFSRLENAATKNVKGTGLGLFITKQIIEKHNGTIWVEPKEKGNSFIFELTL
ncbi:MAG: cache domain-containing protein [Sedimentisphaerales bacterium]|nr:cache domain-containing protein [Sedimentisphaerales bacterium]